MSFRLLVVAKAPTAGRAKTRLGIEVGMARAAELAAAALLDTIRTCTAVAGAGRCRLALAGDLAQAVDRERLAEALTGWRVFPQRGSTFGERLAASHLQLAEESPGPVVQIGMDTPQVAGHHLMEVADRLRESDAVLGEAADGGWWALGLNDPRRAEVLRAVPMSTAVTGAATRTALEDAGLTVGTATALRDVDTALDAGPVAGECPPDSEFARLWAATSGVRP